MQSHELSCNTFIVCVFGRFAKFILELLHEFLVFVMLVQHSLTLVIPCSICDYLGMDEVRWGGCV